jgi:Skp family chaperone for outer membrane proteins
MPDILLLDVPSLLDSSKVGAEAASSLEKIWAEAKAHPEAKQKEVLADLARRRDGLRTALLTRAKPLIAELAKKKSAKVVLERGAVVWADAAVEDITAQIIAKVDAAGPLKI